MWEMEKFFQNEKKLADTISILLKIAESLENFQQNWNCVC